MNAALSAFSDACYYVRELPIARLLEIKFFISSILSTKFCLSGLLGPGFCASAPLLGLESTMAKDKDT
jgi:hypothetical protein